jgi:predicted Zn-dependent protease
MKKLIIQLLGLVAVFMLVWFGLSQIQWMQILKVEETKMKWEDKLGNLYWDFFKHNEKESTDTLLIQKIDSMVTRICTHNHIDHQSIKVHILENSDVNAFVLPGNHIVLLDGLVQYCDTFVQLSGVICHELAHIQLNHISKKLIKEIGLAVLASTTGEKTVQIAKAAQILSSTAFDRNMEKAADLKAVDYLIAANINPKHFADLMRKMAEKNEEKILPSLTWISTHPDPETRATYIMDYANTK